VIVIAVPTTNKPISYVCALLSLSPPHAAQVNEGVIVIAATNIPESLDPALTRPGRFDRNVAVPLPDVRGRAEILDYYLSSKPVAPEVDVMRLARATPGKSTTPARFPPSPLWLGCCGRMEILEDCLSSRTIAPEVDVMRLCTRDAG